jgi:hypothetical protein
VVASTIQISKIPLTWQKLVKEVLLAIEKLGLQHFMKKNILGPVGGISDAVTTLDAKSR